MTPEQFTDNENGDMAALLRIKAFVKGEGFTGGEILKAIDEQIEYVKNGGTL